MSGAAQRAGKKRKKGKGIAAPTNGAATFRIVLGDRRASALAELEGRVARSGHKVIARVSTLKGALEQTEYLKPDAVVLSPHLEDSLGIAAALACTNVYPGIAAVVLSPHPGATNPDARPDWGPVSLAPIAATPEELDAIIRATIARVREAAAATPRAPSAPNGGAPDGSE